MKYKNSSVTEDDTLQHSEYKKNYNDYDVEKVSVVIPTFNRFYYLLNTIESIKKTNLYKFRNYCS